MLYVNTKTDSPIQVIENRYQSQYMFICYACNGKLEKIRDFEKV